MSTILKQVGYGLKDVGMSLSKHTRIFKNRRFMLLILLILACCWFTPIEAFAQIQGYVNQANVSLQTPQQVLDRLKQTNGIPATLAPRVDVSDSTELNAATNGTNILITSALLSRLTTNDQRAFVISHELSHVVLSHIAKTQIRRVGLSVLDSLLLRRYVPQGGLLDLAKNWGFELYDKRSGRVYEYQADDVGIQLMAKAGYNPQAAIEVFKILQAGTPNSRTPEFLLDHPITESRIHALVQKYKLSSP